MAERVSARLTAAEGRRFGLTLGGAFAVFAGVVAWRGSQTVAAVLAAPAVLLVLGGLVVPAALGPIERAWMGLAKVLSKVTTPIVMGVMYLLVLTPVGALRRRLSGNPLVHGADGAGFWKPRPEGARRTGSMRRQF